MTYRTSALINLDLEPRTDMSALTYDLRNIDPSELTREDVDRLALLIDKFSELVDCLEAELDKERNK